MCSDSSYTNNCPCNQYSMSIFFNLVSLVFVPLFTLLDCFVPCFGSWLKRRRKLKWLVTFLSLPVNRLLLACEGFLVFLLWIYLAVINLEDTDNKLDIDFYDYCAGIWTLGYIVADIEVRYSTYLLRSVKVHDYK